MYQVSQALANLDEEPSPKAESPYQRLRGASILTLLPVAKVPRLDDEEILKSLQGGASPEKGGCSLVALGRASSMRAKLSTLQWPAAALT